MTADRHLLEAVSALERAVEAEKVGARTALDRGDLSASRSAIERAERITSLIDSVAGMVVAHAPTDGVRGSGRKNLGRIPKGTKTPAEAFRVPILRALSEMGGSAQIGRVLDRVEQMMLGLLRPVDREGLPSDPQQPRWRNTAQWERLAMVKDGLLRSDSPRGVWEITDAGRRFLSEAGG